MQRDGGQTVGRLVASIIHAGENVHPGMLVAGCRGRSSSKRRASLGAETRAENNPGGNYGIIRVTYLLLGPLFLQGLESLDIDKIIIIYFIFPRVYGIK